MAEQQSSSRRPNLTQSVIKDIRERISAGQLTPGDKLPTEQEMVAEFGVSRTVIREAVAGLRADGLVEARHGVGVFVLDAPKPDAFAFMSGDTVRVSSIVETLELRAAVEVEAAELAAQRCSPGQEMRIRECFSDMQADAEAGESTADADFAFHIAIAEATNNPQFAEFLKFLGRRTIPRSQLSDLLAESGGLGDYQAQLIDEHRSIMDAIGRRDPEAAREAMRRHLKGSYERYREFL